MLVNNSNKTIIILKKCQDSIIVEISLRITQINKKKNIFLKNCESFVTEFKTFFFYSEDDSLGSDMRH